MFVVRMDTDDARTFRAFRQLRDARFYMREAERLDAGDDLIELFDVPDTDDAEIAVMAVRDGLATPIVGPEPDSAVMLASMGLGTGLRI